MVFRTATGLAFALTISQLEVEAIPAGMDAVLKYHNVYRCMHGVAPLQWDDSIAASAQNWADTGTCDTLHHSGGKYGENIYWASPAPAPSDLHKGVEDWYSEVKYTDGGKTSDWCDAKCGHYTALVWKATTSLGCGTCKGTMVCQYNPPGNYQGEFSDNVLATTKSWDECSSPSPSPTPSGFDDCKVNAALTEPSVSSLSGFVYWFKGDQYLKYDGNADKVAASPQPISNWAGLPNDVDAILTCSGKCVSYMAGMSYVFKGNQYWKYDVVKNAFAGGPTPISSWTGMPDADIDAILVYPSGSKYDGMSYWFKGTQYWKYDLVAEKAVEGYPLDIAQWDGLPGNVDAVMTYPAGTSHTGYAYFFYGELYFRYDLATDKVDEKQMSTSAGFGLCAKSTGSAVTNVSTDKLEVNAVTDVVV